MKWSVALGIAGIALVGGVLAAIALSTVSPPTVPDPPAPMEPVVMDEVPAETTRAKVPVVPPPSPLPENIPEGENGPVDLGAVFEGPVDSVADLDPRFDAGMSVAIQLDDLPTDATESDIEKALTQRTFDATARVNAAADAHLTYAENAPREEAVLARGRAADLYEHLSEVLTDAPVPSHFPEDQASIQARTTQHMARTYERKAAALRASGAR